MTDTPLRILKLVEAAAMLRVHKTTLAAKAVAGAIPAAKIGRAWTFIESDLIAHLREQYSCHSTNNPALTSGGCASPLRATPASANLLAKQIAKKRSEQKSGARHRC